MNTSRFVRLFSSFVIAVSVVVTAAAEPHPFQVNGDPFMGDWQGTWDDESVAVQVIALGKGTYTANVLAQFDTRNAPLAVLTGTRTGDSVSFSGKHNGTTWQGTMTDSQFAGATTGNHEATFSLEPITRLSPTMGAKAPDGAIVLFDGTTLNGWVHPTGDPRVLDLTEIMGGENCVAYVRTQVWSPESKQLRLEMGSDDGIKAWLNDELVHANNVSRGPAPAQDVKEVAVKKGWNTLLLKITQGGGGAGVCAQFAELDGSRETGLYALRDQDPVSDDAAHAGVALDDTGGAILNWQVTGPYYKNGQNASELFGAVFPPERDIAGIQWNWKLHEPVEAQTCRWKLLDNGVMEVTSGGIVSTHKFRDHKLHIEFRTPFMPEARGQSRGNSGVYLQGLYEVQVLDSYGLKGEWNECGGIYQVAVPRVNMAAPPLQWQTYDIDYRAPRFDASGRKTHDATITVHHNGVVIHENVSIPEPTAANIGGDIREAQGLHLQDHSNPVQFRNIWAVEVR